jgi:hypothetical protein
MSILPVTRRALLRMPLTTPRLRREFRTMQRMVDIWCRDTHGADGAPCGDCRAFLAYAERRLEKCPYGEDKPTCAKCPVHCYKRAQRELARDIMRYAGPRMVWRHPWLSVMHVVDKLRRVEHPMAMRGGRPPRAGSPADRRQD